MHIAAYVSLAALVAPMALARPMPQIGGDAQACYGIVNNVDNGSGYAIENAEDNLADLWDGKPTGSDSEGGGPGGPTRRLTRRGQQQARRDLVLMARQLNKISAGLANLGDALGIQQLTDPVADLGDEIDTVGTNGQGELGDNIGNLEDSAIPELANDLTDLDPDGNLPALKNVLTGTTEGVPKTGGAAPPPAAPAPAPGH